MVIGHNFANVSGLPWGEVYLIGGGPSLKGFDFTKLQGRTVVAVNDAALHVPFATALFSLDRQWIANRKDLIASFPGERWLAVSDDFDFNDAPSACYVRRDRNGYGLSDDPNVLHMGGGNSGFGAFNLAYLRGAERIVLLGYDFCHSGVHWHNGYSWQGNPNDHMYSKWAERFQETLLQLQKREVEVVNASLHSTLTLFPRVSLETLFRE